MSGVTGVTRRTIRNCYPAASSSAYSSAGGLGTSMYTEVSRIFIFGLRVQVLLLPQRKNMEIFSGITMMRPKVPSPSVKILFLAPHSPML